MDKANLSTDSTVGDFASDPDIHLNETTIGPSAPFRWASAWHLRPTPSQQELPLSHMLKAHTGLVFVAILVFLESSISMLPRAEHIHAQQLLPRVAGERNPVSMA